MTESVRISGTYYDGVGSQGGAATMLASVDGCSIENAQGEVVAQIALDDLRIDAQLGNTPRNITWGERSSFATLDHDQVNAMAANLVQGETLGWVARLERHMTVAIGSLVGVVLLAGSFAVWGVPAIAEWVAYSVPENVSTKLGTSTLGQIDEILQPSELSARRQVELTQYFQDHGAVGRIEFRAAPGLGPNALTLSQSVIVFTDELVELADSDEELLAVYLHELGHARMRHVERSILQNSAWLVMLAVLTGDLSGASEIVLTLPVVVGQMAYSRELERDADAFAVAELQAAGYAPEHLATILEKLGAAHDPSTVLHQEMKDELQEARCNPQAHSGQRADAQPDDDQSAQACDDHAHEEDQTSGDESRIARALFEYFSTHPAMDERIATIRNAD